MATITEARHAEPSGQARRLQMKESSSRREEHSPPRVAHTLTACCRCRQRKTRCDPGLPRCGPCERTNSHCEYYDPAKATRIPRNYVVHLQHKVRALEEELAQVERDEHEDPEFMMRCAAAVRLQESEEPKYLGPSSGINISRLVIQMAKHFTDSSTVSDVVPTARQASIKRHFTEESDKPTSKIYPMVSNLPAEGLPERAIVDRLMELFIAKVQAMYPLFHEPTLRTYVDILYNGSTDPYINFVLRMIIAITLQKLSTDYAGLADCYYIAALQYFEAVVKQADLGTLQSYALIGEYSLLTPTRTAVYYAIGLGVRLIQALGFHEEKTLRLGKDGKEVDILEQDLRRRVTWSLLVMEWGLSHSLGRPCAFSKLGKGIDLQWPLALPDEYITPNGLLPNPPRAFIKKWVAMHFWKMRLIQLDIRRKLYLVKRPEPRDDTDPWFKLQERRIRAWQESTPSRDEAIDINSIWFTIRANTIIVLLFRPSPQIPRPSVKAAFKCYDACAYNIKVQRLQIERQSIDLTWVFCQSIFMAINTLLWSLSYSDVRRAHTRDEVYDVLDIAMEAISTCSKRWPGVKSAYMLYDRLIEACMKAYDKDGDINLAATPSDTTATSPPSQTANSPGTTSTKSLATPPDSQISHQQKSSLSKTRPHPSIQLFQSPQPPQPFNNSNKHSFSLDVTSPLHMAPPPFPSPRPFGAELAPNSNDSNAPNGVQNPYEQHQQQQQQYTAAGTPSFENFNWTNATLHHHPDANAAATAPGDMHPAPPEPVPKTESNTNSRSVSFALPSSSIYASFAQTHDVALPPPLPYGPTPFGNYGNDNMFFQPATSTWAGGHLGSGANHNGSLSAMDFEPTETLTQAEQWELMQSLQTDGMDDVERIIRESDAFLNPPSAELLAQASEAAHAASQEGALQQQTDAYEPTEGVIGPNLSTIH